MNLISKFARILKLQIGERQIIFFVAAEGAFVSRFLVFDLMRFGGLIDD